MSAPGRHRPTSPEPGVVECSQCGVTWSELDGDGGAGECLAPGDEATVYRSPNNVACPICDAPPGEPCQRLDGRGSLTNGWHRARDEVPA